MKLIKVNFPTVFESAFEIAHNNNIVKCTYNAISAFQIFPYAYFAPIFDINIDSLASEHWFSFKKKHNAFDAPIT